MAELKSLEALEARIRGMVFGAEMYSIEGVSEEVQRLYRRLVRTNVFRAVQNACPIARGIRGEAAFDKLVARWLDERPPTTRFLRLVPLDFAEWLRGLEDPPHAALPELVHYEAVEVEVLGAPDAEPEALPRRPDEGSFVKTHPSARLLAYAHPVHRLKRGATRFSEPASRPVLLVVWRADERMRWLEVPPVVAQTLMLCAEEQTLGEAFAHLEGQGAAVDRGLVRAYLSDLCHRGAIRGFCAEKEALP